MTPKTTSVILLCPDPIGAIMRGLGIRYTELARALRDAGLEVTLAAPDTGGMTEPGLAVRTWPRDSVRGLRSLLAGPGGVLTPPGAPHVMRELRRCSRRVAIDLYDPAPFEVLEHHVGRSAAARTLHVTTANDQLADALRSGQFFLCASERQRDLWVGALLASGRITARAHCADPLLRSLVDIVAFGVPANVPEPNGADPIRERFGQIADDTRVLLWNGGLWRWLDAPAAIGALAIVRSRGLDVRLVFMGASPAGGGAAALGEARAAVEQAGLGDAVLFNDTWVAYADRAQWLQAADAVISTHRDHLETRYAFRTRLLDCLWAGVPVVVTGGDELAGRVAAEQLGVVVDPGDLDGLADGIEEVLSRGRATYAPALRAAARDYEWPRVISPLLEFLAGQRDAGECPGSFKALTGSRALPLRRLAQRLTRVVRLVIRG